MKFTLAYHRNLKPFMFTGANGEKTEVSTFDILPEDRSVSRKLRDQARILFQKGYGKDDTLEFAIDLCQDSNPSQVVVCRIAREPTIESAIARVEAEMREFSADLKRQVPSVAESRTTIGPNDTLLVPYVCWFISHRFTALENKEFKTPGLQRQFGVLRQDMSFRLTESGVSLQSRARLTAARSSMTRFELDRPFLVYVKKRGAETPYFAMWVDNAELLVPWNK